MKKNLIFTMLHFFKKNKEQLAVSLYDLQFLRWRVLLGHFLPFYPPKNQKTKIFKKWKSFKDTILQLQSYDVWFLRCRVKQTEFVVVVDHFLPFYPPNNLKIKILKKQKILSGDIMILYMHHKWQSYMWFLRYGA